MVNSLRGKPNAPQRPSLRSASKDRAKTGNSAPSNASKVELCLFDPSRHYAETRVTGAAKVWKLRLTTADAASPVRVSGQHGFTSQARSLALFITAPPHVPLLSAEPEAPVKTETQPRAHPPFDARKDWFSKVRSRISLRRLKD